MNQLLNDIDVQIATEELKTRERIRIAGVELDSEYALGAWDLCRDKLAALRKQRAEILGHLVTVESMKPIRVEFVG